MVTPRWPRKTIDFGNRYVTFVLYPWGAGGKFVINSMAVSQKAVMQHAGLAQQQLDHNLSCEQKQEFILQRLNQESQRWQDLHLGADNLTGVNERMYITAASNTAQYWPWTNVMHELCKSKFAWFVDIHDTGHLEASLRVWPQARVIRFLNTDRFLEWRKVNYNRESLQEFWNSVRDTSWPQQAPENWQEFCALDRAIQQELLHLRNGDIFRYIQHPEAKLSMGRSAKTQQDRVCARFNTWDFDANALLDTQEYLKTMRDLYQWIDLDDFDKSFLECYHKQWLEKVQAVPI